MTSPDGEALPGGNSGSRVVRDGGFIVKDATPSTDAVHRYLGALHQAGIDVPLPHGRDGAGRQLLEFIDGTPAMAVPQLDHAALRRIGALVRSIHDASESFEIPAGIEWTSAIPAPGAELMCHNDLAPWNLLIGERWVFVDWDTAAPSTRSWDLAYAAQAFTLNDTSRAPAEAASGLAAFADGYGADAGLRSTLPEVMIRRVDAMVTLLEQSRSSGTEPWASMHDEGHGDHWRAVRAYVADNTDIWRRALTDGTSNRPTQV